MSSAVEAFTEAINTYDTEALLAVTTEGFTWESTGPVQSRAEFVDHFEANYEAQNFSLEVTGELMVEADGDGYVAEEPGARDVKRVQRGRAFYLSFGRARGLLAG